MRIFLVVDRLARDGTDTLKSNDYRLEAPTSLRVSYRKFRRNTTATSDCTYESFTKIVELLRAITTIRVFKDPEQKG